MKTPSVLFPSVVKVLRNNTDKLRIINKYRHRKSYDLVEEMETKYALEAIKEQQGNQVVIPAIVMHEESRSTVDLMVADNS